MFRNNQTGDSYKTLSILSYHYRSTPFMLTYFLHVYTHRLRQTNCNNNNCEESRESQHDTNTHIETHNYGSLGPTYELIDTSKGVGQTYALLEQCREGCTKATKTTTEDEEHYYHVLESEGHENVPEGGCASVTCSTTDLQSSMAV